MPNSVFTYIKHKILNECFADNILNKQELICLHKIKLFQVLQSNPNNLIWHR